AVPKNAYVWLLFGNCSLKTAGSFESARSLLRRFSGILRVFFDWQSKKCRTTVEAFSKQSRTSVEEQSKHSRSRVEQVSKSSPTAVYEIDFKRLSSDDSALERHRDTLSLASHILFVDHRDGTGLYCILIELQQGNSVVHFLSIFKF